MEPWNTTSLARQEEIIKKHFPISDHSLALAARSEKGIDAPPILLYWSEEFSA
jgi:hypothetical protein